MDIEDSITFRVIDLANKSNLGPTASSIKFAMIAAVDLNRYPGCRFAIERTDWVDDSGRPKPRRSVIIDIEDPSAPWALGIT